MQDLRARLLFLFGGDHDDHPPSFQLGQTFGDPVFLQFLQHFEEEQFTALFKDDGTAPEMDVGFDLGSLFEEFLGVFYFELKVMFIGIGTEADLFNDGFGGIGLDLLFLFPLIVEEFIELNDPADRWICVGGDHDKILTHLFRPIPNHAGRVDAGFNFLAGYSTYFIEVVPDETDIRYPNICVDFELESGVVLP